MQTDAKLCGLKTNTTLYPMIVARFIVPAAALLLLIGHFAPWVAHKTAALTLSAHELAVFTHFTPGAGVFLNQWFYLPLWAAALAGALLAGDIPDKINRMLAAVGCAAVASLGMPGYPQILTAFRNPDYQLQFFISLAVIILIIVIALLRLGQRVRPHMRVIAIATLFTLSAVPLAGYLAVKPAIEQLYNDPVGIGAGWWLTLFAVILGLASIAIRVPRPARPS